MPGVDTEHVTVIHGCGPWICGISICSSAASRPSFADSHLLPSGHCPRQMSLPFDVLALVEQHACGPYLLDLCLISRCLHDVDLENHGLYRAVNFGCDNAMTARFLRARSNSRRRLYHCRRRRQGAPGAEPWRERLARRRREAQRERAEYVCHLLRCVWRVCVLHTALASQRAS